MSSNIQPKLIGIICGIARQLTGEQKLIARFWSDDAMLSPTPPGHWNRIATDLLMTDGHDLLEHARTMALLNLALADAGGDVHPVHDDVEQAVERLERAPGGGFRARANDDLDG